MKKFLISTGILMMSFLMVNAQTDKEDWMVGGNFGITTGENNTKITFTPSAGYFVARNIAVGGKLGVSYEKLGDTKATSFYIGPFSRIYFTSQNFRPFIEADLQAVSSKTKDQISEIKTNGVGYFLGAGAAAFINTNVALDIAMGYEHFKYKSSPGSGGFSMNIGFQVYLSKSQVPRLRNSDSN